MSTRGRASNKKEERKATRQSGDNLPDDKSPDVEKKTTTLKQQRESPTIPRTLRSTTNTAHIEDQQVMSQKSTERHTATYASTVEHQVMSQNTTTLPTSNVPVDKKKKRKTIDGQGFCSGGKSESGGKNPVEQVLQYNESSREYKEDTSNENELLGCQGKSEPERKIPDKHELHAEENSTEPEILGTETTDSVRCEDSKPEEIVNRRQDIDTLAVASTKAKSGQKFGKSEPERQIPDEQEFQGEKKSSDSEVRIVGTENPDCVQHEDSVSQEIFNTRQEIETSVVVSAKAKPDQESGKGEPEGKIPDKHGLQDEIHSSDSEVRMMITENPDSVPRKDDLPEEIVNERQIIDTSDVASTNVKSGLMNVGTDDMSDAADEYEVEGADASHGIFTLTAVEDAVIHMHLIQIALLVHSDRTTVLAQPNVNHRALSINDIKNGDFITKMQEKNNDYAEEMHALVYEIRTVTSSAEDNVAVFSTYNTTIDTPEGHQIINVEAIYPTLEGLKKLSKAMGFSNSPPTNDPQNIVALFQQIAEREKQVTEILHGKDVMKLDAEAMKPNNAERMQAQYAKFKEQMMNQPIRLAMLGGLQRTGLTAHLMGNFRLHNAPPHQALKSTYKFNGESSISVKVPLHIMLPRDKSINELLVVECAEYSKKIQDRKTDSFQTTIKAQLHDILSASYKHTDDINPKRFTQLTYWTQREVSSLYSGKKSFMRKNS